MSMRRLRSVSASFCARYGSPLLNSSCARIVLGLVRRCNLSARRYRPEFSRGSFGSNMFSMSMSMWPMTAPEASSAASLGTSAGLGSSMFVCSVAVSFAASPGSARAVPRIVSASHRRTAPLQGGVVGLARADAQHPQDVRDKDLAVADLAGFGSAHNGFQHLIHEFVLDGNLDARLRDEVDDVFGPAVQFGMAALAAEALDLGDSHARNPDFR